MPRNDQIYIYIAASILLLLFDFAGFLSFPTLFIGNNLVKPVKSTVYRGSIILKDSTGALLHYSQIAGIAQDAQNQKKLNTELDLKIKTLTEENLKLRHQLDAPLPPSFKYIPSYVVSVSRYMEIMAGTQEEIKSGMTVVDGTTLIGQVKSAKDARVQIILPSDPEIKIPAKTTRGAKGEVVGQAGSVVVMDKILQKDQVFIDDVVVTSGEGGFPPNLIIGNIRHINTDDVSPYKQAKIEPAVDYTKETNVFILTAI